MNDIELLTRQQVEKILGIRRSTIYKLMRQGKLPTPITKSSYELKQTLDQSRILKTEKITKPVEEE